MWLNKLKSGRKTGTEVSLKLSSNVAVDASNVINFLHKFLLTNNQISRFCKAFANKFPANVK